MASDQGRFSVSYSLLRNDSLSPNRTTFSALLQHSLRPSPTLKMSVWMYEFGIVRCLIEETKPGRNRFRVSQYGPVTIDGDAKKLALKTHWDNSTVTISPSEDSNENRLLGLRVKGEKAAERHAYSVQIDIQKFKMRYLVDGKVVAVVNEEQLLNYEEYRTLEQQQQFASQNVYYDATKHEPNSANMWFDTFGGKNMSIPYGPSSVGLDFKFPDSQNMYGLPLHTTSLQLEATVHNSDPYRLFHTDVYGYDAKSKKAIYGSIPYILAVGKNSYTEMLWLNGADTWIDIFDPPSKTAHWISETGVIEFFLFFAPSPEISLAKLHLISGKPPMPLYSALGYHQSRYSYVDEKDVYEVDKGFDSRDIPFDSIWLDIDHTLGRRYFTWNKAKFPNPTALQNHFADESRFVVSIVDPHIAEDKDYSVYNEGLKQTMSGQKSLFIRDENKKIFYGKCWPGSSAYFDYLNADARDYWAKRFSLENYKESTTNLFIWNDMNEPSVFESVEMTIPKNCIHSTERGEIFEHREVHNVYGILMLMSTYEGLRQRDPNTRPFVLARSFYLGSQRYGAIWTGDCVASWDHLAASLSMILSTSMGGQSFAGADAGGYKENPSDDLLVRWYQLGTFYPFFRGHSDMMSKRREPWLFSPETNKRIREAILNRYTILPYLYTLFYEYVTYGTPIWRPLFYHYPNAPADFVDKQFMFGPDVMVIPVLAPGEIARGYLPPEESWYSLYTLKPVAQKGVQDFKFSLDEFGAYARGGTIMAEFWRLRRSSKVMRLLDPYTVVVFLNERKEADGYLYIDDGESWDYTKKGAYLLKKMSFKNGELTMRNLLQNFTCTNAVERIVIVGYNLPVRKVTVSAVGKSDETTPKFDIKDSVIEIQKPKITIYGEYSVKLQ